MPAFQVRSYLPTDLTPVVRLLTSVLSADTITERLFVRKVLLDPNFDPNGGLVAVTPAGEVIGFALALVRRHSLEDGPDDSDRGWLTLLGVQAEYRRQGIGSALLHAAETWLGSQHRTSCWISPYAPHYWTPGVDEAAYPDALAFLHQRGYTTILRPLSMEVSLQGWQVPEGTWQKRQALEAEGVTIAPLTPTQIPLLTAFLRHEFPGDWQRYLRETLIDICLERRPADNLWGATQAGEVIGFAQFEGERFGPFGVAKATRGRGVGVALLGSTLETMQKQGCSRAWFFWTDDRTAERIYRPFGFQETRRYALLKSPPLHAEGRPR